MHADVSDSPLYNTAAVVQRTGVPATTIRAWERRYNYPKPQRDAGGQRLYSERDIQAIAWLANQTAHGVAISRAVNMLRGGFGAAQPVDRAPTAAPRSFEALRTELQDALLGFDAAQAESLMGEAFALFTVEDVCLQVIEPLLVDIGNRWHAGEVSVAEEHYISAFMRGRLFALLNAYQRADTRAALIFTACGPGEWHEAGILLVSVFLARRGFGVRYFGPNLPLASLAEVVARHHPAVVALSAHGEATGRELCSAARMLGEGTPPRPQVVFGGQAFNDDLALRLSVEGTYAGPDAAAAVTTIAGLVARPPGSARRRTRLT